MCFGKKPRGLGASVLKFSDSSDRMTIKSQLVEVWKQGEQFFGN